MVQRKEQKLKFRKSEYLTGHLQNKATIILYSSIPLVAEVAATSVLTDVQLSVLVSTSESHSSETGKQQSHCNYICVCISISIYMYVCIVCDNYIYYCVCITSQLLCDIYIYHTKVSLYLQIKYFIYLCISQFSKHKYDIGVKFKQRN